MEPGQVVDGITHVTDTAATQGPIVYLAVLVVLILAGLVVFIVWHTTRTSNRNSVALLDVVSNNTKALCDVSQMVARTCSEIERHEALEAASRQEIHDNRETVRRVDAQCDILLEQTRDIDGKVVVIDERTRSIDTKLDKLVKGV